MNKDTIYLIDAYAQIYRGFYGVRNLSNPDGKPTNAIYAMAKFLLRMHEEYSSSLGVFAFDKGRPQFRLDIAPDYKGNRSPMPDELRSQIADIRELVQLFGWNIVENEKLEADDIVAVIAKKFADNNVRICSADKDIAQVINDRVQMLIPDREAGGLKLQGLNEVIERFNVRADQIIDYLSFLGDSADNIPGVPGIGVKTAAKLLNEFDSIDNLLLNIDKIKNIKQRDKILDNQDILKKNVSLIELCSDFEDEQWGDISKLERREPDWAGIAQFAEKLHLKSIVRQIKTNYHIEETEEIEEKIEPYTPDLFG